MPTVDLPRDRSAPALARRALERFAPGLDDGDRAMAALLVTELVSNAVRHGAGRITLSLAELGGRLRVEVADEGIRASPRRVAPDFVRGGGFGLHLVEELSASWGIHDDCSQVWFEMCPGGAGASGEGR